MEKLEKKITGFPKDREHWGECLETDSKNEVWSVGYYDQYGEFQSYIQMNGQTIGYTGIKRNPIFTWLMSKLPREYYLLVEKNAKVEVMADWQKVQFMECPRIWHPSLLNGCFIFGSTPEGRDFWMDVRNYLESPTVYQLPKIDA